MRELAPPVATINIIHGRGGMSGHLQGHDGTFRHDPDCRFQGCFGECGRELSCSLGVPRSRRVSVERGHPELLATRGLDGEEERGSSCH